MTAGRKRVGHWWVAALLLVTTAVPQARGVLSITVGDTNLPLGAATTIELFLQPSAGAVSAVGATLGYAPADLAVDFAGINQFSLGGPTAAVHRVHHGSARVCLAAARPGGSSYTAATNELIGLIAVTRLGTNAATVSVDDAFVSLPGPPSLQDVPLSDVVFGITPADSDEDGVPDLWEFLFFGNLTTVGVGTDFDGDGSNDLAEFNGGTNPRIPFLTQNPELGGISPPVVPGRIVLSFSTELNVEYRIQRSLSLRFPVWMDTAFATAPAAPATTTTLLGTGGIETIYLEVTPAWPSYYRIGVRE